MAVTHKLVTAQELLEIPNDGLRRELVRGEVRTMAPAGNVHGRIAMNFSTPLDQHVRANGLGVVFAAETGFKISVNPDTVRAPDTAFVRRERAEAVGDWLATSTRMVIVVNPHGKTVTVRHSEKEASIPSGGEAIEGGEVVPGWTLPVADVFR